MKLLPILVGILAASAFATTGVTAQSSGATPTTTFEAQNSGGHAVVVKSVEMPVAGFVAIHDATLLDGKVFESVVGISDFLPAGSHANVRVFLTRALAGNNETLIAMPHKDSNGNRIYDFVSSAGAQDGPFIGGANAIPEESLPAALKGKGLGGISAVPKAVNNTAYLSSSAQTNGGASLLLDFVDLSVPGYVAVHDATLVAGADASGINPGNVLTSVVGVSDLLPAGISRDVPVYLNNNCAGCRTNGTMNGTLIPMAHKETGGNATRYDFVSSAGTQDGPFTGQPGTPLTAVINIVSVTGSAVATEVFPAQATGGRLVLFPEVFVPQGGYAAVHDASLLSGNVLGSVIGVSSFLKPGLHRNVTVELTFNGSKGVNASTTLVGMLHRETNNNTSYDFVSSSGTADGPYTGGPNSLSESQLPAPLQNKGLGGVNAVPAEVNLSASAWIPAQQLSSDGKTIRLNYVDLSTAGFVALHDESLLANAAGNVMTSVVGVSQKLEAGLQRNVTITLPGSNCGGCAKGALNTSQTLIAMPHKDSNSNGVYDFITSGGTADGPFTTAAAQSNTVNALNLNIVVSVGRVTAPIKAAAASTTPTPTTPTTTPTTTATPATPTMPTMTMPVSPTVSTPVSPTPASPTPTAESGNDTPGFGVVAALAAAVVALAVLRGRKA